MMKSIVSMIFAVLSAALCFTSCLKETPENGNGNRPAGPVFHFSSQVEETKSVFGEPYTDGGKTKYPVYWTANDTKVRIATNYSGKDSGQNPENLSVTLHPEPGTKNAWFEASPGIAKYPVTFTVISPANSYVNFYNKESEGNGRYIVVDLFSGQRPTANSPDEQTQILVAESEAYTEGNIPDKIQLTFKHVTASLLLRFTNVVLGDATVQGIFITTTGINIAGRYYYYPGEVPEGKTRYTDPGGTSMGKTISVHTASLENVWVSLPPTDLTGETLTFEIVTDKGKLSKSIALPGSRQLQAGKIYSMSVNMSGADLEDNAYYQKLDDQDEDPDNDFSTLADGDEILIASAFYNYAIGTTQNSNNRGAAGVIKSGNYIVNPPANTEIITLEAGTGDYAGYWHLKANGHEGYLHNPVNNANRLRTAASVASSYYAWSISEREDEDAGGEKIYSARILRSTDNGLDDYGTMGFNPDDILFTTYRGRYINGYNRQLDVYRRSTGLPVPLSAELSASQVSGSAQSVKLYIFGSGSWTAAIDNDASFADTDSGTSSGSGSTRLTVNIPEYTTTSVATSSAQEYTITVTPDGGGDAIELTLTQNPKTVFPVQWLWKVSDGTYTTGVDFSMDNSDTDYGRSGMSYVYSSNHEAKITVYRPIEGNAHNKPTFKYRSDVSSTGYAAQYLFLHYSMNLGSYWLFEVSNVENPAGTYTIGYDATSSGAGPKCYIVEYSADNGSTWTATSTTTAMLQLKDGTDYGTVTYTYLISPTNNTANEPCTVSESFHLDAFSGTLMIRARVSAGLQLDRDKDMSTPRSGGTSRLINEPSISFTAD